MLTVGGYAYISAQSEVITYNEISFRIPKASYAEETDEGAFFECGSFDVLCIKIQLEYKITTPADAKTLVNYLSSKDTGEIFTRNMNDVFHYSNITVSETATINNNPYFVAAGFFGYREQDYMGKLFMFGKNDYTYMLFFLYQDAEGATAAQKVMESLSY